MGLQSEISFRRRFATCASAVVAAMAVTLAGLVDVRAQNDPGIAVELNRLMPSDDGCLVSFVMKNATPAAIDDLGLEVVLFDSEGRVERILLLSSGALPIGKTRVKQFNLENTNCGGLSQILINDVASCEGDGLDPEGCLAGLRISSRDDQVKLTL